MNTDLSNNILKEIQLENDNFINGGFDDEILMDLYV